MPTIRKRANKWQAQVRRAGYPAMSRSFSSRSDALAWAREKERSIDRADLPPDPKVLQRILVGDILKRYEREITPKKRGALFELSRIRQMLAHPIAQMSLNRVTGSAVAQYRDDRLRKIKPPSVRRELVILRHVFETAVREWGMPLRENPLMRIRLPVDGQPRERRLNGNEESRIYEAITGRSAWYLRPFIVMLIETGARRSELLSIRWQDVDFENRTMRIIYAKNGHPRRIPLTPCALATLRALDRRSERIFPVTANAVRLAWERLRDKVGIVDLRMHDLRHEAVSRFFEFGLSSAEVATISGHREPRMLSRYTHLRPELIAAKLDA